MRADAILERKGHDVATIGPDETVAAAVASLVELGIGALVVSRDGSDVQGVISEREVVRRLVDGAAVLDAPVRDVMASPVHTCDPSTSTEELMALMTESRFRHVPVVDDGQLVGIVSIGDVVKVRIDELAHEREQLASYITGA